ncbi:MAG: NUDIX domain-containing protein [Ilumatobacteraceae bacterium]
MSGPDDAELLRQVSAAVAARTPVDERERASIERFATEVARLAHPFDEQADPVHITASALIVGPRGIVLHRHKRLGIWVQPGGHIDAGELPWDAAVREAVEETGLPARLADPGHGDGHELAHVDVHPGPRGHTHLDLRYLLEAGDADPAPPPGESQDVVWLDWDEALAVAEPGMAGILRSLAARFPT